MNTHEIFETLQTHIYDLMGLHRRLGHEPDPVTHDLEFESWTMKDIEA